MRDLFGFYLVILNLVLWTCYGVATYFFNQAVVKFETIEAKRKVLVQDMEDFKTEINSGMSSVLASLENNKLDSLLDLRVVRKQLSVGKPPKIEQQKIIQSKEPNKPLAINAEEAHEVLVEASSTLRSSFLNVSSLGACLFTLASNQIARFCIKGENSDVQGELIEFDASISYDEATTDVLVEVNRMRFMITIDGERILSPLITGSTFRFQTNGEIGATYQFGIRVRGYNPTIKIIDPKRLIFVLGFAKG